MRLNRRDLLVGATALAGCGPASAATESIAFGQVVEEAQFARLELLCEGVWAVVSTPLDHNHQFDPAAIGTLCNGGLIAGRDKLVAIDGFYRPDGAAWLSDMARKLTGRNITDVILTHFHADHVGGLAGYQRGAEGPAILATETTRQLIIDRYTVPREISGSSFLAPEIRPMLPTEVIRDSTSEFRMELGERTLRIDHLGGHTPSDLAIWVENESVVFAGDLVWSGLFHNYVDATPSRLRASAAKVLAAKNHIVVPGHGYVARARDLSQYLRLLDFVEEKARAAIKSGADIKVASADFVVPERLGEWRLFAPDYYERAFRAWERELSAQEN